MVSADEVRRLSPVPERHRGEGTSSARNRLAGRVISVEVGGVMALVEIEAGPFRPVGRLYISVA